MKQIILISGLLFAILSTTNAQNLFKAPQFVEPLHIELDTPKGLNNMFSDYVNFLKENQNEINIQQPDPKVIQRHEWHLFPKPLSVKKFNNKVVVVFDRKQWEAFSYMHRKMWMRRMEMRKQIDELETIRDKYKRK